ncbi:MAG: helix-turn-helix domain-containing protein [Fimbriimonas sp.]
MPSEPITQVLFQEPSSTPLGRLVLAATMKGTGIVPRAPLRVYGRYGLMLLTRGSGVYVDADGRRERLQPGDLVLVFPDWPHWYGTERGRTWDELHFVFEGPVFDLWRRQGLIDPARPIRHLDVDSARARLTEFAAAPGADAMARLHAFLPLLADLVGSEPVADRAPWVGQACDLLATELSRPRDAAEVAARLGMGTDAFRKRFAAEVGVPPARYRLERRLAAAQDLLIHTAMTHREIAERLGFADEFTFSKRFRAVAGVSPRGFRQGRPRGSDV